MSEKAKILMIDDERDIVHFFAKTFENFPHIQFFTANRAAPGLEIAAAEHPKVVMLDLRMPEMDGEEALVELKRMLPESKFIVMTGWDESGTQERVEEIGVDAYYKKPIDLEKVVTKIMSLLMVKNGGAG